MSLPDELLALALDVALEAGALAHRGRRSGAFTVDTKTTPTDPVTEIDRAVERLVVQRLLAERPDDAILGEEGGGRTGTSGVAWVIDPIDGTTNFVYDLPHWAVSIAARLAPAGPGAAPVAGDEVAAVVRAPVLGHTWAATSDGPATRDGAEIACSRQDRLEQALVGTGFGYDAGRRARQGAVVAQVLPRVRDVRRAGAASLDLCSVADGRLDAYYERGLGEWDLAAGGLVARRAGAVLGGLGPDGRPSWVGAHQHGVVVAAGRQLYPALHRLLSGLDADRNG